MNKKEKKYYFALEKELAELKKAEELIRASLNEKELLLREIHHRAKNNMQIISSMLRLQSLDIKDEKYLEMFRECENRINTISLVYESLYHSRDLSKFDFKDYIKNIINGLFYAYNINDQKITIETDIGDISLDDNIGILCGLIINELVTNSLKYAFPEDRKGKIKIAFKQLINNIELIVSDNGIGIPEEFDFRHTKTFGLHLVTLIAEKQLEGEIVLNRINGTKFTIVFEKKVK